MVKGRSLDTVPFVGQAPKQEPQAIKLSLGPQMNLLPLLVPASKAPPFSWVISLALSTETVFLFSHNFFEFRCFIFIVLVLKYPFPSAWLYHLAHTTDCLLSLSILYELLQVAKTNLRTLVCSG
jgi:hypothetical protein